MKGHSNSGEISDDEKELENLSVATESGEIEEPLADLDDLEASEFIDDEETQGDLRVANKRLNNRVSEPQITKKFSNLEEYSDYILKTLISKNVLPTPLNYTIFFEEFINSASERLKQEIEEVLLFQKNSLLSSNKLSVESDVKNLLKYVNQILDVTSKISQNINTMSKIIEKRSGNLSTKNIKYSEENIDLLLKDFTKLTKILSKQKSAINSLAQRSQESAVSIIDQKIIDTRFNVYNKKHFINTLRKEKEQVEQFKHKSSILLLIPDSELSLTLMDKKVVLSILKAISKVLIKNFRSIDTVAYYGHRIFSVLMPHNDILSAEDKVFKLTSAFRETNIYVEQQEIKLKVVMSIAEIKKSRNIEDSLLCALDALQQVNSNADAILLKSRGNKKFKRIYEVCEKDKF
jgi:diguanylate cyclase (GGDEF)-like protein